jgi:hypothetical protein
VIEEMYNREASSLERLARLLHEDYLAYQRGLGAGPAENQAAVEWEDLPKDFRRSNLEQTKNLAGRSLDSIGCYVLPSTDLEVNPFTFSVEEIETLAKEEHERWLRERREKGWTWGAVRNDERRHNPNIREWADLDQDADGRKLKDYNRAVVKRIPQLLAEVDYEIRRF